MELKQVNTKNSNFSRIKIVYFRRKPLPIHKSIEFIFESLAVSINQIFSVVSYEFTHYSKGIWNRVKITLEARRHQGDINHITGDIHFAAILLDKRKTILTIHDCAMLDNSKGIKHQLLKLFWFTIPLKKCAYLTVVSQSTKQELLKYVDYPEDRIRVVPVAVSNQFVFSQKVFDTNKPVILQYCTTPNKNALRVIKAVSNVSCKLILVGKLTEELQAELSATKIDYNHYFDISLTELILLYQQCDILSFVSTYEGFGMPIIEAQAVGRPVITSNILSMPEVSGGAAALVDPYNVEEIKQGILQIIENRAYRETLVRNGLINSKRYNGNHIADLYLAIYKEMLS